MDREIIREALQDALVEVLEDAAFTFAEPAEEFEGDADWPGPISQATLSFMGPLQGRFQLLAPAALCTSLAADMLGDPTAEAKPGEVLGELLNMAAGIALERSVGTRGQWHLGVPRVENRAVAAADNERAPASRIRLLTEEDEPIEAAVFIDRGDG